MPETLEVGTVVRVKDSHNRPEWRGKCGSVRRADRHPVYGSVVYIDWQIEDPLNWSLGDGGPWTVEPYLEALDFPYGAEVLWTGTPQYWSNNRGRMVSRASLNGCSPQRRGWVESVDDMSLNVYVRMEDGCRNHIHVSKLRLLTDVEQDGEACSHCGNAFAEDDEGIDVDARDSETVTLCEACVVECEGCGENLHPYGSATWRINYGYWCSDCTSECGYCRDRMPSHDDQGMTNDDDVWFCDDCHRECEGCGEDLFGAWAVNHDRCEECQFTDCCSSPAEEFTIRNDGKDPLRNDTRVSVSLGAGEISEEGITGIYRLLRNQAYLLHDDSEDHEAYTKYMNLALEVNDQKIGTVWQTKEGNFTKRLSRHAYKKYGLKVPPDIISGIGNIASDHSQGMEFEVEVTRLLNQHPREFAHAESCWWQSYSESRCALKTNGGFGLRSYRGDLVSGRAWVLPIKKTPYGLSPTFNTMDPDGFIVFNGYGDLGGYNGARVLAHMTGLTYRKIDFEASPMYVNAGGYLVAGEALAENYTDGGIGLDISTHSNLFDTEQAEMIKKEMSNA